MGSGEGKGGGGGPDGGGNGGHGDGGGLPFLGPHPSYDNIYVPFWNLTPQYRFQDLGVCQDFFNHYFPPAEVEYQRGCARGNLDDDYIRGTSRSISSTPGIVREWVAM